MHNKEDIFSLLLLYIYIFYHIFIASQLASNIKNEKYKMKIIPFLAFSCYHGNHFVKFLAHVLSWVKTYRHAEFQRNPPTGLAGMMVQTYRQTDRQTDRGTDIV